jgi:hypothetical protein
VYHIETIGGAVISIKEILMGRVKFEDLSPELQANVTELHTKINLLRTAISRPLKVNDGLRRVGVDMPKNGAAQSNHYLGFAIDIDDDDSAWLWQWVLANLDLMQEIGLFMEDPRWTHGKGTWMHFQIRPPKSGKRIYIPVDPTKTPAIAPDLWDGHYDKKYDQAA